jgi:3',5'-cyclic AMP phosphodiesterase CpdA
LHLSDIHFSKRSSTAYDPDLDLRRELLADAIRVKEKVKACSGILVSGDIAFSGKSDEYNKARDWLREICHQLDCPEEAVWVIPGNHDVDREVFRKSTFIQDKHQKLRTGDAAKGELEHEMLRLHDDPEAFEALHRALAAYIKFAGGYGCKPEFGRLYWEDDLPLNDESTLRLRGCNSALVSRGDPPDDENANRLVAGRQQFLPPNVDGVTYLLICHHPLDWLHDRDALKDNLKARTRVALFGHKHVQRVERVEDVLVLMAGAVHPDRAEGGWKPCYNYLGLSVEGNAEHRQLLIELWPRYWDDVNKIFRADFDVKESDHRVYRLPLPVWAPPPKAALLATESPGSSTEVTGEGKIVNPKRRLVYRFHGLPYVRRLEVVTKLKLVTEEDQDLKEEDRNPLYFRRAEESGILDQLWTAVEQQHGVDLPGENPFAKKV